MATNFNMRLARLAKVGLTPEHLAKAAGVPASVVYDLAESSSTACMVSPVQFGRVFDTLGVWSRRCISENERLRLVEDDVASKFDEACRLMATEKGYVIKDAMGAPVAVSPLAPGWQAPAQKPSIGGRW